jgi:hypothetical protein
MTAEPERRFDATGLKLLEAVAPLRDLLSELVAEAQHIRDAAGDLPAAESPAMAEIANEDAYVGAWAQQPLKLAQSIAGMCLAASEDQLATLFVVLSKCDEAATFRAPAFGHMSIARSVVESCARAGWLLEPIISYEDRATRAIGELLYSNWERARATQNQDDFQQLRENVRSECDQRGLPFACKAGRITVKVSRPGNHAAVRLLLRSKPDRFAETMYSYYSAIAHGVLWG